MTARDDYPNLTALARCDTAGGRQMNVALDEIDRLRALTAPSPLPPPPPPCTATELTPADTDGLDEARRLGRKMAEANKPRGELDALLVGESEEYRAALLGAYSASFPERRRSGSDVWQVRARTAETVESVKVSSNGVVSEYRCAWPVEDWESFGLVTP